MGKGVDEESRYSRGKVSVRGELYPVVPVPWHSDCLGFGCLGPFLNLSRDELRFGHNTPVGALDLVMEREGYGIRCGQNCGSKDGVN